MKATVKATKATQQAIPELGRPEKTTYFAIIEVGEEKIIIRTGEENYEKIKKHENGVEQTGGSKPTKQS